MMPSAPEHPLNHSPFFVAAVLVVLPCGAALAQDLFASLDANADGFLDGRELHAGLQAGGWVVRDVDRDGRIARLEFAPYGDEPPVHHRASRLVGMPVRDATGSMLGVVDRLLVDRGRVVAVEVQRRAVPWSATSIGTHEIVADGHGAAPRIRDDASARTVIGVRARAGLPVTEGRVQDLVVLASGEVVAVVLLTPSGTVHYPWWRVQFDP